MSLRIEVRRRLSVAVRTTLLAIGTGAIVFGAVPTVPASAPQEEFPTTAGEAMRYYEGRIEKWIDGPVDYIILNDERDIWDDLETDEQKSAFIEWFWARRDDDIRSVGNEFKEEFYEAVAFANQRFRSFPRGWKSDQGHVVSVLGRPDAMVRRTWASVYGGGMGPDFEVWRYTTLGTSRAFSTSTGDYYVYFVETRIGNYEIWDFGFRTAGVFDRNIRTAFEYTMEGAIIDPMLEFEPVSSTRAFVREVTEGTLPVEIPVASWNEAGAGGTVSLPLEIGLGDLLFVPEEGQYAARLEVALDGRPQAGGEPIARREAWLVRMGQDELAAVGNGTLVTAVSAAAPPGVYDVGLVIGHPLAATEAQWGEAVEVGEAPAAGVVAGRLRLRLSDGDPAAIAVLRPFRGEFGAGEALVIGAWLRGVGEPASVSVQLQGDDGSIHAIEPESVEWLGGPAGPLLIRGTLPQVPTGPYRLHVDLGPQLDVHESEISIAR